MKCCSSSPGRIALIVLLIAAMAGTWFIYDSGVLTYRSADVTFTSTDGVALAGTIVMPREADGALPGVVLVHGSGRVDRGDQRADARRLVDLGLAVIFYDKRGVGESGGEYSVIPVADSDRMLNLLADDAAAALEALAARPEVDASRVGFVGGSQAGWIMPLAAIKTSAAQFIIATSGPAVTYGQEVEYSRLTGDDSSSYEPGELSVEEIEEQFAQFDGPHGYDPVPVLASLRIPSLWLIGGQDQSVPQGLSVDNFKAIAAGGNDNAQVIVYPNAGHDLSGTYAHTDIAAWLAEQGILGE